jgi:leucyl aminopeptidase (aminopeptidase T)
MKQVKSLVVFLLSLGLLACATPQDATQTPTNSAKDAKSATGSPDAASGADMPKVDYAAIASKLVEQCAGIKEGDIVQISGGVKDAELLEDIAVEVRRRGAFPLLTFSSDRLSRKIFDQVPEKYDSQINQLALNLAGMVTARISVPSGENPALFADVTPERMAERTKAGAKASETIAEINRRRAVPNIVVGGNNLFPTADNAKMFGFTQAELARIFWDGVNTDYASLQADGEKYRRILEAGKEVHLTHPNGTDFRVRIEKRPVYVSDGVVSAEDRKRGIAATTVYLPAGEVIVTPVPGTAEGKIVVDRDFNEGREIEGLTLEFKAGKLTSMTAKSDITRLKAAYDSAPEGKELFGVIDIGINRNLNLGPKARRGDYAPAGMVTIGIGTNIQYGGENKVQYGYETNLPGCTLKIDGNVLVENGVLKP